LKGLRKIAQVNALGIKRQPTALPGRCPGLSSDGPTGHCSIFFPWRPLALLASWRLTPFLRRRQPDLLDQLMPLPVFDVTTQRRDRPHHIVVPLVKVGVDLDLLVRRCAGASRVVDHAADVTVQLREAVLSLEDTA